MSTHEIMHNIGVNQWNNSQHCCQPVKCKSQLVPTSEIIQNIGDIQWNYSQTLFGVFYVRRTKFVETLQPEFQGCNKKIG